MSNLPMSEKSKGSFKFFLFKNLNVLNEDRS